jgi:hypothetical protein
MPAGDDTALEFDASGEVTHFSDSGGVAKQPPFLSPVG